MKPEPLTKRLEIRKKIQEAGKKLYESIEDEDLKWLTGEIMALNEDYVLTQPDTQGAHIILEQGFTDNQLKWIKNLDKKLKNIKERVHWLLKEIEKKKQKILNEQGNPDQYYSGYTVGLMYAKLLIKKAFSWVIK